MAGNPAFYKGMPALNPTGVGKDGTTNNRHENFRKARHFLKNLERACLADNGKRIRAAAEALLDNAAAGEPWAIQMLADRCDGKVGQDANDVETVKFDVIVRQIVEVPQQGLIIDASSSDSAFNITDAEDISSST